LESEHVLVERDLELSGLVTITLNRPEKLNAVSLSIHQGLQRACAELRDDGKARVVIVTGAGRAFSSGADLGDRSKDSATSQEQQFQLPGDILEERTLAAFGHRTTADLENLPQVTIGAINGLAIGAGVAFLTCLDIRLAASSAWFSIPEVELEFPLTLNTLPRLMRDLGPARTKELVMTCDRFSAEDALRWGFVNHVVPDGELMPAARGLAAKLLAKDPMSLALTKTTTNALASAMVPTNVTHSDADYIVLRRLLHDERARNHATDGAPVVGAQRSASQSAEPSPG
jgi:enoyl-CoA hydratase/carnithine racemase